MSAPLALLGSAVRTEGPRDLEDWFPGRWDPKRALHADLRPLVAAAAAALEAADLWRPGERSAPVEGGLVVAVDHHGWGPALRFARAAGRPRPSDFLHSLPSTPAATLGILFGLSETQATVHTGAGAGLAALAHAADLVRTGRLARALVAGLSAVDPTITAAFGEAAPLRLAAALVVARASGPAGPRLEVETAPPGAEPWPGEPARLPAEALSGDIASGYRVLAAPTLAVVARASERSGEWLLRHRDPWFGDAAAARVVGR